MGITRRATLAGLGGLAGLAAAGYALVDHAVLPGKSRLDEALGRCDAPAPDPVPGTPPPLETGTFRSVLRARDVGYALAYPPGHPADAKLPVCLALHGFGSDAAGAVHAGEYPRFVAGQPFVVAGVDGGNGYWHPHPGDDPLGMLMDEFVPLLTARGLDTGRLAVAGWSMGGYGAMLCALTHRDRFKLVVASSPAIFHSYADAERVNPGAYDSPDDWSRHDLTARAAEFAGVPLRIAIGAADPFAGAVRTLRERLPDPAAVSFSTGCHDGRFWSSIAPDQVRALGTALR